MNEFFTIVGLVFIVIGIISIFDARIISKNDIFKGKQNDIIGMLKIAGFIISVIGLILIYNFFIIV